jgi:hypothetical protein
MLLSTSSFERWIPNGAWYRILAAALLIFLLFVAGMEIRLNQLGYHPTVLDSKERWVKERARASQLGKRALILIGASRIQLDIDLDALRQASGLEPIQLAVDGSSFVPVLKNMAADPSIVGTILIDYNAGATIGALNDNHDSSAIFVKEYEKHSNHRFLLSLNAIEKILTEALHENLRSFADGTSPLNSLQWRIIPNSSSRQYLTTHPDRSRLADYTLVYMPDFYYARVARNLGEKSAPITPDTEQVLRQKISKLQARDNRQFIAGSRYITQLIRTIRERGGKVQFISMPTSGMVLEIDDKLYPRARFLDVFEQEVGMKVLNSADEPTLASLASFHCPDGSHLDLRDRKSFTLAMAKSLRFFSHQQP